MKNRNLFIIHNHKNFSGAARSIGETIQNLKNKVSFIVICPKGSASEYFKSLEVSVVEPLFVPRFNHFELGYYRSFRWIIVLREIFAFIYFCIFLIFMKKKYKTIQKIHLNEIELVIISPILNFLFKPKISSHLRSPLELNNGKLRYNFLKFLCKNYLYKLIAIDNDCYLTSPIKNITKIIYNGINKKNLSIKIKKLKRNEKITFGFIGNFIERKGIYEILEVFRKNSIRQKANLICIGKNNINNILLNIFKYEKKFQNYFDNNDLNKFKNIKILPMTYDLKFFYSKIDVIIFPSFMNAVGRPVIEASLLKKPSIIALKNYNNDTAIKGNCLIFEPGNLKLLEKSINFFIKKRTKIKIMGELAFQNAKKIFDINKNSKTFFKNIC